MRKYRLADGTEIWLWMTPLARKICELLSSGVSADEIQKSLCVHRDRIKYWNKHLGLPALPRRARKKGIKYGSSVRVKSKILEVRELRNQGFTYREIAAKMGFTYQRAHQLVNRK